MHEGGGSRNLSRRVKERETTAVYVYSRCRRVHGHNRGFPASVQVAHKKYRATVEDFKSNGNVFGRTVLPINLSCKAQSSHRAPSHFCTLPRNARTRSAKTLLRVVLLLLLRLRRLFLALLGDSLAQAADGTLLGDCNTRTHNVSRRHSSCKGAQFRINRWRNGIRTLLADATICGKGASYFLRSAADAAVGVDCRSTLYQHRALDNSEVH